MDENENTTHFIGVGIARHSVDVPETGRMETQVRVRAELGTSAMSSSVAGPAEDVDVRGEPVLRGAPKERRQPAPPHRSGHADEPRPVRGGGRVGTGGRDGSIHLRATHNKTGAAPFRLTVDDLGKHPPPKTHVN